MSGARRTLTGIATVVALIACALTGCDQLSDEPAAGAPTGRRPTPTAPPSAPEPSATRSSPTEVPSATSETPTGSPSTSPAPRPVAFEARRAMRVVRSLAGRIGPREATSEAYYRAADLISNRFADLGYDVFRQVVRVPAGVSWGVPVSGGRSVNVVADPAGFDPTRPHLVVGAHLDTVPQAPGAEDNASGVAVLLELARLASREDTRLPVRFIAFGAEEPRGEGEALHHFGSHRYVDLLDGPGQRAVRGMLSLDRVGVPAAAVPVCTGGIGTAAVQRVLVAAARTVDVSVQRCVNTSSDHWSFEQEGMPAARIGGVPYAGYHSAGDVPRVVDPRQLDRVGRVAWAWLRPPRAR